MPFSGLVWLASDATAIIIPKHGTIYPEIVALNKRTWTHEGPEWRKRCRTSKATMKHMRQSCGRTVFALFCFLLHASSIFFICSVVVLMKFLRYFKKLIEQQKNIAKSQAFQEGTYKEQSDPAQANSSQNVMKNWETRSRESAVEVWGRRWGCREGVSSVSLFRSVRAVKRFFVQETQEISWNFHKIPQAT